MDENSQRPKSRDGVLSSLNVTIEALNLAKEISGITPAKAAFGSVSVLLTMIRDSMGNELDYVELGLSCADICRALERGMSGKKLGDLSQSVCDAINQLTTTVAEIQRKVIKQGGRNAASRLFHASNDKEMLAGWKLDLNRILHIFNTELVMNVHVAVSGIRQDVSKMLMVAQAQTSLGESPPPAPRAFFGREELIEQIVDLAKTFTPVALIGPGGIGKTSIALAILHHHRIKEQFGDNCRFIRCDQFPASRAHFLSQLSKTIGAGLENPEDLTPLRPFLSSREMILFLDNAESILDPRGANAQDIYAAVEELSEFSNVCLCLTSRMSTIPPACESLDVPTLSMAAARDTFYRIYKNRGGRADLVNSILEQLDFHPLSITLLATVAYHNKWDMNRLAREWERRRTEVLCTQYDRSLAATIELSLASPMFQELGSDARGLLGIVAFFPQGVDENNLDWLFPTISDRAKIFDNFCVLSLTHRSSGFITMLAPLRDYLRPKEPASSPLLDETKEHYLRRLSVEVDPGVPGFEEARWIVSEDANVEHLLDVLTSIDTNSVRVWDACAYFMRHLYWHKTRLVALQPKIEGLPDDHPSKPECLFQLSRLFDSIGNHVECKRLLLYTLKLRRERGDDFPVAETLRFLSDTSDMLDLYEEGIQQAKEALGIYERLDNVLGQARSWKELAWLLYGSEQFDAAEEAALRAINISGEDDQFLVSECHRLLGKVYESKGETGKATDHFETALGIATTFNWHTMLFWIHHSLALLSFGKSRFEDARAHAERAKSHAIDSSDLYLLGRAMELQAKSWYRQRKLEEAKSVVLGATDLYEKIGATGGVEDCRAILRDIEEAMNEPSVTH